MISGELDTSSMPEEHLEVATCPKTTATLILKQFVRMGDPRVCACASRARIPVEMPWDGLDVQWFLVNCFTGIYAQIDEFSSALRHLLSLGSGNRP